MFNKSRLVPVLILMAAVGVPATSTAASASKQTTAACLLQQVRVTKVTPYRVEEYVGRGTVQRGASVFVQAVPGLTAEWLEHRLREHLEAMGSTDMANCPLDVSSVKVRVDSGGSGFWVRLIAPDARTGQEVLHRAQTLLR